MRKAVLLLGVVFASGCVKTDVVRLGPPQEFPPVPWEEVGVYASKEEIEGEYVRVARVTARGHYRSAGIGSLLEAIRKKAAKLGANGVVLEFVVEPSASEKVADFLFDSGASREASAIVVRVLKPLGPDAPSDAEACPAPCPGTPFARDSVRPYY